MPTTYYNENDPYAAQWLRNLIAARHIAPGDVDERSIIDVRGSDLAGYDQCHFFAGIGGWPIALRLAGWPDDRPVWTGSCPCQPFSIAGAGKAANDERHLWPAWFPLIQELRPAIVFGEQVAAAIGWGWLDAVFADLEGEGYACGASVLPACGVGTFHIRQRLWFVAHDSITGREPWGWAGEAGNGRYAPRLELGRLRSVSDVAYANAAGFSEQRRSRLFDRERAAQRHDADGCGPHGQPQEPHGSSRQEGRPTSKSSRSFWADTQWIACTDGKSRPTQPGLQPLAHGVRRRTSKLRAYGNAIVPQAAAAFIENVMEIIP